MSPVSVLSVIRIVIINKVFISIVVVSARVCQAQKAVLNLYSTSLMPKAVSVTA